MHHLNIILLIFLIYITHQRSNWLYQDYFWHNLLIDVLNFKGFWINYQKGLQFSKVRNTIFF